MRTIVDWFRGVHHPEGFHGHKVHKNFFEGWYIKLVSADQKQRWAVIPGVFKGLKDGTNEAFIQILDGSTGRSWFHRFNLDEFSASANSFDVSVADNHFDGGSVTLNLEQLSGRLEYADYLDPWPITVKAPGIMGWYGLVPFMECFHGIVSFGHGLTGSLAVEGKTIDFTGGRGYIEKDWGKSFPAGYVWLHSNHLTGAPDASLIGSVAIIPWLGKAFRGYIVGFKHGGVLHQFTTYNGSKEKSLVIDDSHVRWTLSGPSGTLSLVAERVRGGLLHAPMRESIHRRLEETMDSSIQVRHTSPTGVVLYEGLATSACLEVFGDIDRLLAI
jgi:tocopherol cyclase